MAAITRQISNGSFQSSRSSQSLIYNGSPNSPSGGGILANAHEAPKKPIKPADGGFTSALKAAFIPPQAGKQMKRNGKPLGKSFERTSPLPTKGHEGGEVLKRDPRGENANVGDGVVLTSESDEEDESGSPLWTPLTATSSTSSAGDVQSQEGSNSDSSGPRGRSATSASRNSVSTGSVRSMSRSSTSSSSNNPCKIKFAPLPSSGRLKRANSITIGVAARSHLLQSQGSGRTYNSNSNAAAWQAAQSRSQGGTPSTGQQPSGYSEDVSKRTAVLRHGDTVDLGEELRKGVLKAFRKMKKGGSVSEGSGEGGSAAAAAAAADGGVDGDEKPVVKDLQGLKLEESHDEGELTPKRSASPTGPRPSRPELGLEESDGTRTPRQRRTSTGAFIGNNPLLEIEENRTRALRGEVDADREELARFTQALGRTHATTVAHHTEDEVWHPGMLIRNMLTGSTKASEEEDPEDKEDVYENAEDTDDPESLEAERMADEALKSHSEKATKAGAIEKMERHH